MNQFILQTCGKNGQEINDVSMCTDCRCFSDL